MANQTEVMTKKGANKIAVWKSYFLIRQAPRTILPQRNFEHLAGSCCIDATCQVVGQITWSVTELEKAC